MCYTCYRNKEREDKKMKATGIIRRVDDLGRVVIPKEIRRKLRIKEGEPLEVFLDEKERMVGFQKYTEDEKIANLVAQFKSMTEDEKNMFLADIGYWY